MDAAFDEFDTNGDGVLSRAEFGKGLKLDLDLTMEEKDVLMARLDSDGSGKVSAREFVEYVLKDDEPKAKRRRIRTESRSGRTYSQAARHLQNGSRGRGRGIRRV